MKQLLPLRKGIADTTPRALVSQGINRRFANHVASTRSSRPLDSLIAKVNKRQRRRGRSVRGLDTTGKDCATLRAIADPRFIVAGFANKDLRIILSDDERYLWKTSKQQSGITTRSIRRLRDHGVICKLPNSRRYQLTAMGRQLVIALKVALATYPSTASKIRG